MTHQLITNFNYLMVKRSTRHKWIDIALCCDFISFNSPTWQIVTFQIFNKSGEAKRDVGKAFYNSHTFQEVMLNKSSDFL